MNSGFVCPKCGSNQVVLQESSTVKMKNTHHGLLWWVFVGWWWMIIKWVYLFWIALFVKLFIPKKRRIKQKFYTAAVCQDCGHRWKI